MLLAELFMPMLVNEITDIAVDRKAGFRQVKPVKDWESFRLLDRTFDGYLVAIESDLDWRHIMILDRSKLKSPGPNGPKHKVRGLDKDIPDSAIVGGIQLEAISGTPFGKAWKVAFMAFNPRYQGQGIPPRFYAWLINNADLTGIKVIKAGTSQTLGSKLLWSQLSKMLKVVAYDPETDKKSSVQVGPDRLLTGDFPIYNDKRTADIRSEGLKDLQLKTRSKREQNQRLTEYERNTNVELYAMADA